MCCHFAMMCRTFSCLSYVTICLAFLLASLAQEDGFSQEKIGKMFSYLRQYDYANVGNFPVEAGNNTSGETPIPALAAFQTLVGINATGLPDDATLAEMEKPRCGNDDYGVIQKILQKKGIARIRRRRFTLVRGWQQKHLTYKILNYSPDFSRAHQESEISRAFDLWSSQSQLTFQKSYGREKADIEFKFGSLYHGDAWPFDGPYGTLAHAAFPEWGGYVHYDEAEKFTYQENKGVNFFYVTVHELGHALGLDHSDAKDAVMFPIYRKYDPNFTLGTDDIQGIQKLYGKPLTEAHTTRTTTPVPTTRRTTTRRTTTRRTTTRRTTTRRTTTRRTTTRRTTTRTPMQRTTRRPNHEKNHACSIKRWDAALRTADGTYFIFSGYEYFTFDPRKRKLTGQGKISDVWEGIHGPITTGFTISNGITFLIVDGYYHMFYNRWSYRMEPKKLTKLFPGLLDNVETTWQHNSNIYGSFGNKFYNARKTSNGEDLQKHYVGAPNNPDAAFSEGKNIYFLKDEYYFKFDVMREKIVQISSIRRNWLGCQ